MRTLPERSERKGESGGITILVTLMLLVFITLTAVGMSRNSFREVVISGTARQGSLARNVADSGMEWSIYWLDDKNALSATAGAATNLGVLKTYLNQQPSLSGKAWDLMSPGNLYTPGSHTAVTLPSISTPAGTSMTQAFTAGLTRMGKLPITDVSQGVGSGAFAPATGAQNVLAPDLWAFRADAQVTVQSVTFIHAKELWVSTPINQ